jgi:hypothetical protein
MAITRRADKYVEMLDESGLQDRLRVEESRLLDTFEKYVVDVLDRYVPPGPRRRDRFVFGDLYSAVADPSAEDHRRSLIAALLAAETEARGPLRLTQAQNVRLAQVFELLGKALTADGLPLHAVLAFSQAAQIYLQVQHSSARDRCLLAQARARHRARRCGWIKALETISAVLCGYGYQPHRLLGWIALQLVGFSVALTLISAHSSVVENVYACLINYLNPLGVGDTKGMPRSAWILFVVEAYFGAASLSVFFALLVRRWFRL